MCMLRKPRMSGTPRGQESFGSLELGLQETELFDMKDGN